MRLRVVGLVGVALVLAVGIAVFLTDQEASIEAYRVRDDDTVVITALGGTNWIGTRVHQVTESDEMIRVWVRSFEWPFLPHNDRGVPFRFVIDLDAPLGDRLVVNGATQAEVLESEP